MILAKKSLGQNFLVDEDILNLIVNLRPIKDKTILEIGPGTGNLTSFILEKGPKNFSVIEKDDNLAEKLFKNYKNKIKIINEDYLKIVTEKLENLSKKKVLVISSSLRKGLSPLLSEVWNRI